MALIGMPLAISLGRKSTVVALCSAVVVSLAFWLVSGGFQQLGEHALSRCSQSVKGSLEPLRSLLQLLKLDVEGSEIEILERLLDSGQLAQIPYVLVEMHDTRIPSLAPAGTRLRAKLAATEFEHVLLDWI